MIYIVHLAAFQSKFKGIVFIAFQSMVQHSRYYSYGGVLLLYIATAMYAVCCGPDNGGLRGRSTAQWYLPVYEYIRGFATQNIIE